METINIFLTGSTGFLGGRLIQNLVNQNHNLYVLVRDLEKANKIKLSIKQEKQKHIHFLKGDITKANCGLSDEIISELRDKVDIFYHLAALVKFDFELEKELFEINYHGTKHALDLAVKVNSQKFYYVSTAYTIGKMEYGVEELYPIDTPTNNPYEDSKIKSEHLVFSYKEKLDISIFRPSIIVGDSKTGQADSHFTLYGFIRGLEVFKKRMERKSDDQHAVYHLIGNREGTSNLVPVDYVCDVLTVAVEKAQKEKIYLIVNTNPPTNFAILKGIKKALMFENLAIVGKESRALLSKEEITLNSMIKVFDQYLDRNIKYKDSNTRELIEDTNVEYLNMDSNMLNTIIQGYRFT
ncbi:MULTISPECIES: SDR family oxidoreductase [unclassified Bacillus (in: firmicutes)]|uniref:SDR family oxidoreductase n=1 Tax=unclassified Bacillus (in: firmicutes) TaxID=185979 RepID=UPI0008EA7217|nr:MULTISPECIES: SDR family oxidoreductase [unclassified Bacillus (in: firmicutes)]SFA91231.1 Male sterility protein [Bacillus sp. UNCCL13]SFQ85539.1 Male sterility protein [Bacillus sp. cl95]